MKLIAIRTVLVRVHGYISRTIERDAAPLFPMAEVLSKKKLEDKKKLEGNGIEKYVAICKSHFPWNFSGYKNLAEFQVPLTKEQFNTLLPEQEVWVRQVNILEREDGFESRDREAKERIKALISHVPPKEKFLIFQIVSKEEAEEAERIRNAAMALAQQEIAYLRKQQVAY